MECSVAHGHVQLVDRKIIVPLSDDQYGQITHENGNIKGYSVVGDGGYPMAADRTPWKPSVVTLECGRPNDLWLSSVFHNWGL